MPTLSETFMRDYNRYTGDGLPDEPVDAPLPVGDPESGAYVPTKADMRAWGAEVAATSAANLALADAAAAAAAADAAAASASANSFETNKIIGTLFDRDVASLAVLLADTTLQSGDALADWYIALGAYVKTLKEGFTYRVVTLIDTALDLTTAGGIGLAVEQGKEGFNVRAFNAKGDGTTVDTTAIQAAVTRAGAVSTYVSPTQAQSNTHNGTVVYFPSGRYISDTITMLNAGVSIRGASQTNTQIEHTTNTKLFVIGPSDPEGGGVIMNISISDIELRGSYTDPDANSIAIEIGIVKHCYIRNVRFGGFYVDIWSKGNQEPLMIDSCNFFAGGAETGTTGDGGGVCIRLDSWVLSATSTNRTYDQVDPDIADRGYAHSVMVFVSNCEFRNGLDAKATFFDILSCDGLYVTNCHLLNANDQMIKVSPRSAISPAANIKFSGNFFDGENAATEYILNINAPTYASTAVGATVAMEFYDNKYNGVGQSGETGTALARCNSQHVTSLIFDGGICDKCAGDYWFLILRGARVLKIQNLHFKGETGYAPLAFVSLDCSLAASNFFTTAYIKGNTFEKEGGTAGSTHNVRLNGNLNKVFLQGNAGILASSGSGDGLVYDTKTTGTRLGAVATHGNAFL